MLLIVQYPLVDCRQFLAQDSGRLPCPVWPIPRPDTEFIRNAGAIRRRWRGGLSGWVSESLVCEADGMLRLDGVIRYREHWGGQECAIRGGVAFRRFYFDGTAVGKFELGVWIDSCYCRDGMLGRFLEQLLVMGVHIANPMGEDVGCRLFAAGPHLAHLYLLSSSHTDHLRSASCSDWWVQDCDPILFLTNDDAYTEFERPFPGRSAPLEKHVCGELSHHYVPADGRVLRMWYFREKVGSWYEEEDWDFSKPRYYNTERMAKARELRIYMLRLHAERECLKQVLRHVRNGKISPAPRSKESDALQDYLNASTRRILRLRRRGDQLTESGMADLAREAEAFMVPGEVDDIVGMAVDTTEALERLDVRPNIIRKIKEGLPQEEDSPASMRRDRKLTRILFLAANPTDTHRLRLDEEVRAIDDALLQRSKFRDMFDLEQQWAVRAADLQGHFLRFRPDIVHFSGHGSSSATSGIILEDSEGNSQMLSGRALSTLFEILKGNIRCVVLNSCYSEGQARAIAEHVDCVVGMSRAIRDDAAISFAKSVYQALGYGEDVKAAFSLGTDQIDLEGLEDQDIPKLLDPKGSAAELRFVERG